MNTSNHSFLHRLFLSAPIVGLALLVAGCSSQSQPNHALKTNRLEQTRQILALNQSVPVADAPRVNFRSFVVPGVSVSQWRTGQVRYSNWVGSNKPLVKLQSKDSVVNALGVSANGMFAGSIGTQVDIWDLDTLSLVRSWAVQSEGRFIILSPNGNTVVSGHTDNTIRIWQKETGYNSNTISHDGTIIHMAISPTGDRFVTSNERGQIFIWDLQTGRLLFTIEDSARSDAIAFSEDGNWLISSSMAMDDVNHTINVWETRFYTLAYTLPGHLQTINGVAMSPDSRLLASVGKDNLVRIWSVRQGMLVNEFGDHTDDIVTVRFSKDGRWVITSALDSTVRIWDVRTGRNVKVIQAHYLRPETTTYTPEKGWILSVNGSANTISVWASDGFTLQPWSEIRYSVKDAYQQRSQTTALPFVPKPNFPSLSGLKRGQFESQASFIDRITVMYGEAINQELSNYRRAVDERNRRIIELKKTQGTSLPGTRNFLHSVAVQNVVNKLGNAVVMPMRLGGKAAYDADRETMLMRLSFTQSYFKEDIMMQIQEGVPAQMFYKDLERGLVIGDAQFDFISNTRIRLAGVRINWRGKDFFARPVVRGKGYRVVPEDIQNIQLTEKQVEFQKYDLPFTNFAEFVANIVMEERKAQVNPAFAPTPPPTRPNIGG